MQIVDRQFHYTESDHELFLRQGYRIFDRFLSPEGLAHCRRETDRMLSELEPGRRPEDIFSPHQLEPWLFELASQPAILDLVERQAGPNIVLWSSQMLCKPPRTGRAVPWHQDAPYWNVTGNHAGGLWIPLDDISAENGGMSVLPGWHNKGVLPRRTNDQKTFSEEIDPAALPPDLPAIKFQYAFPAGGLATHHTLLPHNSIPNNSDRWRRVIVFRYIAADATFGDKQYQDYRTGERFPRRFFLMRGNDVMGRGLERSPFVTGASDKLRN
jgi:ectoine hydroxylase-related dioxygenase (phytanoyl-CoA dioxygenase family)